MTTEKKAGEKIQACNTGAALQTIELGSYFQLTCVYLRTVRAPVPLNLLHKIYQASMTQLIYQLTAVPANITPILKKGDRQNPAN